MELGKATRAANGFLETGPAARRRLRRNDCCGPVEKSRDLAPRRGEVRLGPADAGRHVHVGVLADSLESLPEVLQRDPELDQPRQPRVGRQEETLGEAVTRLASRRAVLRVVHLHKAGVHARLDGTLAKQARAEGMDRADETGVEVRESSRQALPSRAVLFPAKGSLQGVLETLAQLRGGPDREGHGG